ncbi:MAG: methylmalonyl Co-A mutase-associated GTPase MeaB [Acidobacteria bacterium]|nr:methylmalonyl Co-A mutase-associated GTPase MeaB [Acidobacteriota bacterium]
MTGRDVASFVEGVRAGDRAVIGKAVTLVESTRPDDEEAAQELLAALLPYSGDAQRIGITGVPGVGKSTFIESFGGMLTRAGHSVAVLAVDPSSGISGGSILGDKTRMQTLAVDPNAFIRPSPAAGNLGGVAKATRESMIVLEAAGYDVVLVETVGVGQSEAVVASMVDFFLVLMLPGAGDELQGIKRGILEHADLIAVNKADGTTIAKAREAARDYMAAVRLLHPTNPDWVPPVLMCSGQTGDGLDELWSEIERHRDMMTASGALEARRADQQVAWMWAMVDDGLRERLRNDDAAAAKLDALTAKVRAGTVTAAAAAAQTLLAANE